MRSLSPASALPGSTREYTTRGFAIRELGRVAKIRVQALGPRGRREPTADPNRLPHQPNRAADSDPVVLWRAPNDWMLYSQSLPVEALTDWVGATASYAPLVVTDVSSSSCLFDLSGARSVDILMRDCTLDLEGDAIPRGACAQTAFAQTTVMLHRPVQGDSWRLFVERSVALHVWEWVVDSAGSSGGAP